MFKKEMALALTLLIPTLGFCLFQMVAMRTSDLDRYRSLMQDRALASSRAPSPTNQHRKQVRKDIWFTQDPFSRLHYQISSEASLLTLTPIQNKFEIVEELQGIRCWMQDKLYVESATDEPMQQSRFIEAEEGQYRYTTQEFTASGVTLSLFRIPGHEIPSEELEEEDAFLKGIAHDISFLFSGKTPQFQAENFQATMVKE